MSLSNAFTAYVDAPSDATLRPLHRAIVGSPNFSRATTWLYRATELAAADRHDEVIRLVEGLMPGALFCPDAHALLSTATDWAALAGQIDRFGLGKHREERPWM